MKFTKLLAALFALALVAAACGGAEDVVEGATDVVDDTEEAVEEAVDGDADAAPAASGSLDVDAILAADPACGSPVSGDPIVVGYAADFSDLGGFADGPGSEAVGHFINLINCSGGVNGQPVSLEVRDISGDPEATVLAATELLEACLLYTSPSPRDLSTSRMPSSA